MKIRHLDLFSGIGGFALAVDEVWPGSEHIFCEIDPFCQALLKKRFEGSVIHGDIRQLTADTANAGVKGVCERQDTVFETITNAAGGESRQSEAGNGREDIGGRSEKSITTNSECLRKLQQKGCKQDKRGWTCDLLTAGVPCQPASCAGKRRGTKDDRWLWPEAFRIIRETQPRYVILENVRGILTLESGLVFKSLLIEMESCGYEARVYIIPAVAVNAPHRRDRVWIVANRKSSRCLSRGDTCKGSENDRQHSEEDRQQRERQGVGISKASNDAPNACDLKRRSEQEKQSCGETRTTLREHRYFEPRSWQRPWLEVATELCGVDDGLPAELDGLKLSKARHRVERLKALGNSIVPQVAIEIMKAIKEIYDLPPLQTKPAV